MNYKKPHAICAADAAGGPYHLRVMVPLQTVYGNILLTDIDTVLNGHHVRQFTINLQSPGNNQDNVHLQDITFTPPTNTDAIEVRVIENGIVQGDWFVEICDVPVPTPPETIDNETVCFYAEDLGGNDFLINGIQNISAGYTECSPVVVQNHPLVELTFEYKVEANNRTNLLYHSHTVNIPDNKILKGKKKKDGEPGKSELIWIIRIPKNWKLNK